MPAQRSKAAISAHYKYAIIGAGVSGLYAAWRLATERPDDAESIAVFEARDRIGGRLLTWLPRGPNGGMRAELGGMRFLERHELVWKLIHELGLGAQVMDFQVGGDGLRLLLRGRSTPLAIADPGLPYLLATGHRTSSASALLVQAMKEILASPENKKHLGGGLPSNRKEWDDLKPYLKWKGLELWNTGLWNLLADSRNFELYQYIRDGFGYYSLAENWNAAEAMQNIFLDGTTENPIFDTGRGEPGYKTLEHGFDSLPRELETRISEAGCEISLNTRLVRFERPVRDWVLELRSAGDRRAVEAENLVLALPRRSLEALAPSSSFNLEENDELRNLIQSVTPIPAFKLFLFYETRWWEGLGITAGRSVSDLPLRQTYYFAPNPPPSGNPGHGMLMASYSDSGAVAFWSTLIVPKDRQSQSFTDYVDRLVREGAPEPPSDLREASPEMLRHAKAQLALLHGWREADIPDPECGACAYWGLDPPGAGGWSFWNPGVQADDVMEQVRKPLKGEPVYIVGEAYSGIQGWVEGALTTTERALQDHLDLDPPGWLREDYYLGR